MEDKNEGPEDNEKFIRWQNRSIDHLTYTSNVILVLTTFSMGYFVNLIFTNRSNIQNTPLFLGILSIQFIIIIVYVILSFNRAISFRTTAKINNKKYKTIQEELREKTRFHDKFTWPLFYLETLLFLVLMMHVFIYFLFFILSY